MYLAMTSAAEFARDFKSVGVHEQLRSCGSHLALRHKLMAPGEEIAGSCAVVRWR